MLVSGTWPTNMQYLSCDDYDGTNTPNRSIDLKSYFTSANNIQPSYGNFSFPKQNVNFNGNSFMKFDMEISSISIRGGASVNTKPLGTWTAGLSSPLNIIAPDDMRNLTADVVYRVFTVEVNCFLFFCFLLIYIFLLINHENYFVFSNIHL